MTAVALAILLQIAPLLPPPGPPVEYQGDPRVCQTMWITGYVRTEFSAATYDGTSIYTSEPIAAASWWIPIDSYVEVEGVGTFRVADRGYLGASHIDIAVWSRQEAYALTGYRHVCVEFPS